jgi:uncharacterized protein YcfJ
MSKSVVVGTTLAVLGLGGLAFGAWQAQEQSAGPRYAEIVSVEEITRTIETPREVCEDVQVQQPVQQPQGQARSNDPNRLLGSAAGAVVGGLLGNQVGGGSGKKLATVAGAIGGGLAGREIQERIEANQHAQAAARSQPQTRTVTREECRTVIDTHEELEGYEVAWRDGEEVRTARLEEKPEGDQVELEEGAPNWQKTRTEG